jgi:hypothetical protein
MGKTISGVTLGEGVMLGTNRGVDETEMGIRGGSAASSLDWGVGGVGAPHSPGSVFLEQAVNKLTIIAI